MDDEFEETEEGTDPSHQSDRTGATNIVTDFENKLKGSSQSARGGKSKSDDDELDAKALQKKKNSKVIQTVIVIALIIFLASDYIFPPEAPAPEGKLKTKALKPAPKTETPVAKPAVEVPKTEMPVEAAPTTETPVESPVDVTSTEVAPEVTTPEAEPTEPAVSPSTEPSSELSAAPTTEPSEEPAPEPITTEPAITETPEEPVSPSEKTASENNDGMGEAVTPGDENLTDQILQDLEKQAKTTQEPEQKKTYVAPPDYEYRGRGLVYNCSGKHWACVDAPSYKTCEENSSSVSYLKKKSECYPFNVYETQRGCENMQNRMVSSSAKTQFCND